MRHISTTFHFVLCTVYIIAETTQNNKCLPHVKSRNDAVHSGSIDNDISQILLISFPRRCGGAVNVCQSHFVLLVFLGRFPIRPVTQSASSYGLASWTGQQGGPRERWKGHKTGAVIRSLSLRQQPLLCIDFQRIADRRCLREALINSAPPS